VFEQLHLSEWERIEHISEYFILEKRKINLVDFVSQHMYELVYFDAFAPTAQPELWTKEVFEKLYSMMQTNGILVTYCSKGDVRRAMGAAGFGVEKIPGPMGKREMVRARRE
jgi:tRNA U34 5-methylaminomethyl-2-thiouridine-forming methyltransferase MnmC